MSNAGRLLPLADSINTSPQLGRGGPIITAGHLSRKSGLRSPGFGAYAPQDRPTTTYIRRWHPLQRDHLNGLHVSCIQSTPHHPKAPISLEAPLSNAICRKSVILPRSRQAWTVNTLSARLAPRYRFEMKLRLTPTPESMGALLRLAK